MISIPQYPLYAALIELFQGKSVHYFLKEEQKWSVSMEELERSLHEARLKGVRVRGLVLINPGNPTGTIIGEQVIRDIIDFCFRNEIVLLADEVY